MQNHSPELSAQDIDLVHRIIVRAQGRPDFPSRPNKVLFDTYDAVFTENGLDTKNDRSCLRLLLQLGGPGIPGHNLEDKFEYLLAQAGIVVEYDDHVLGAERNLEDALGDEEAEQLYPVANANTSPRKVGRRNSFTSMYDVTTEAGRIQRRNSLDRFSEPRADYGLRQAAQQHDNDQLELREQRPEDKSQSFQWEDETQATFDDPEAREAGREAVQLALRAAQLQRNRQQSDREAHTSDQLRQIMEIAAQKDKLTLLKQAFGIWRNTSNISRQQRKVHEIDVALETKWEQQFQHAALTYNRNLVDKAFYQWAILAKENQDRDAAKMKALLEWKVFTKWHRYTMIQDLKVDYFTKRHILAKWLGKLRERKSRYEEAECRVQRIDDWRVARKYFDTWLLRTRMSFNADAVNELRLKRNAFSAWNERLRFNAVRERIDQDILVRGLYRWVLAQRTNLLIRRDNARRIREALHALVQGYRHHQTRFADKETQIVETHNTRLLRSTWECWRLQMNLKRERDRMATEFYNPKIQLDSLSMWRDRVKNVQRQELRAQDARYYFLMVQTIKQWHAVTVETKRKRLNGAYKRTRRLVKANLLERVLHQWHSRVEQIQDLDRQSHMSHDQKARAAIQNIFVKWQIGALQWQQSMQQASSHYESHLLRRSVDALVDAARRLQTLESWADRFHSVRDSAICSTQLRRISMKAFEIKRRQQDADAMHERHWAKHLRSILRHWAMKSKDVTLIPQKPSPSTEHETIDAGYGTGTGTATAAGSTTEQPWNQSVAGHATLAATRRAEEWTAFDQDLLEGSATPGYLNTPSRRAARVRALASVTNTPATPWPAGRGGPGGSAVQLGKVTGRRAHLFRDIG